MRTSAAVAASRRAATGPGQSARAEQGRTVAGGTSRAERRSSLPSGSWEGSTSSSRGVSGAGKTLVATELERRGEHVVHGDRELAYQGIRRRRTHHRPTAAHAPPHRLDAVRSSRPTRPRADVLLRGSRTGPGSSTVRPRGRPAGRRGDAAAPARRSCRDRRVRGHRGAARPRPALHRTQEDVPAGTPLDATRPVGEVVDDCCAGPKASAARRRDLGPRLRRLAVSASEGTTTPRGPDPRRRARRPRRWPVTEAGGVDGERLRERPHVGDAPPGVGQRPRCTTAPPAARTSRVGAHLVLDLRGTRSTTRSRPGQRARGRCGGTGAVGAPADDPLRRAATTATGTGAEHAVLPLADHAESGDDDGACRAAPRRRCPGR